MAVAARSYFGDLAELSLEILLAPYLTLGPNKPSRLEEKDVREISTSLSRMGRDSWSRVPRIYIVLRMINHLHLVDSFIDEGVSDLWFPFSHKTLPENLRSASARFEFLEVQDVVLTKALDLEREDGKHRHFSKPEDIPLIKLGELGKGGFGYVDCVVSTITHKQYARKLIPRGRNFKKDKEALRDFEREISNLKKMSHKHIIELVGSYTDPKFVGIIMSPVADYNLKDFLNRENLPPGERSFLRTFFGCLAAAVCYLHENRIRHKDIKPQNVLVKGHQVILTDFGLSLDWSELDQSTTTGVTFKTPRYCAPEVANYLSRNSLSDTWSLGCVFLEIWTVLKGETVDALVEYLKTHGSKSTCYHLNCDSALELCSNLEMNTRSIEENPPLLWIRGMLQIEQDKRWTSQILVDNIQETNDDPDQPYTFSGTCCIGGDDSTDSEHSWKRSSRDLEETGASSVEVYDPRLMNSKNVGNAKFLDPVLSSTTVQPLKVLESDLAMASTERWVGDAAEVLDATTSPSTRPRIKTNESLLAPPERAKRPATGSRADDVAEASRHAPADKVTKGVDHTNVLHSQAPISVAETETYGKAGIDQEAASKPQMKIDFAQSTEDQNRSISLFPTHIKARSSITSEILVSQRKFAYNMRILSHVYSGTANAVLTQSEIEKLFGNLDDIAQFSKAFLRQLELTIYNPDHSNMNILEKDAEILVGKTFLSFWETLGKLIENYNLSDSMAFLSTIRTRPAVLEWLKEVEKNLDDLTNAPALEGFLKAPVTQIEEYSKQLHALTKETPTNHADYSNLLQVCTLMRELWQDMNRKVDATKVPKKSWLRKYLRKASPVIDERDSKGIIVSKKSQKPENDAELVAPPNRDVRPGTLHKPRSSFSEISVTEQDQETTRVWQTKAIFKAVSIYEFTIDKSRAEPGLVYLSYAVGELFDVFAERGDLWFARSEDDPSGQLGWIWNKHCAKLAE